MDDTSYIAKQDQMEEEYEDKCVRCGLCCGKGTDPCADLILMPDGRYQCRDYANRLGEKRTVSGAAFHCVEIREAISMGARYEGCGYLNE